MYKRNLLKFLLPLSAVTLIGVGASSSIILISCSVTKSLSITRSDSNMPELGMQIILNGSYYTKHINPSLDWNIVSENADEFDLVAVEDGEWIIAFTPMFEKVYSFRLSVDGCASNEIKITTNESDYVGKIDGTDWKGRESGNITMTLNNNNHTAIITDNSAYCAQNLCIPNRVAEDYIVYTVIGISDYVFDSEMEDTTYLTGTLELPNTLTSIGNGAFTNRSELSGSLLIPKDVTSIGYEAFRNCTGFDGALTIHVNTNTLSSGYGAKGAFYGCSGFTRINLIDFTSNPTNWNDTSFSILKSSGGEVYSNDDGWNSEAACSFLKTKGLPATWTPGLE